jgi:hypothetical protein
MAHFYYLGPPCEASLKFYVKCEQINTFLTRKTHPKKQNSSWNIIPFSMQHETPFRLLTIIEFKSNKFMDEICSYWCNGTCPFIFVLGTLQSC